MLMSNKLVRNEQTKLTATYINGLAMAIFGIGCFTPVVGMTMSAGLLPPIIVVLVFGCMCVSLGLHLLAKLVLQGLEE